MKSTFLSAISLAFTVIQTSPLQVNNTKIGSCSRPSKPTVVTAPLTDYIRIGSTDLQWYITIYVGTPPQEFTVLIDTGSNMLLLPQSNCSNCGPNQRTFDPSRSSTYVPSTNASQLELYNQNETMWFSSGVDTFPLAPNYGNGPGEFTVIDWAVDNVMIEGLTAPNFTFMLTSNEASIIADMPGIDGVLGLSLVLGPQRSVENQGGAPPSLQYALFDAGLLETSIFSMYIPAGQATGGQLTLGGVDETKFEGDLTWVSLNTTLVGARVGEHTQWVVNMQTIFVNGQQLMVTPGSGEPSAFGAPYPQSIIQVLDTGFPVVICPDNVTADSIYAQISPKIYQIDPNGAWGCSCGDMDAIVQAGVEITFLLGYDDNSEQQLNVTIPSSAFNLGPYPGLKGICQGPINHWIPGLFYLDTDIGLWALGSNVLKNYYTAWDGDELQVGFARLRDLRDSIVSSGIYAGNSGNDSNQDRSARGGLDERQLEPANIGLGGSLMMAGW